MIFVKHCTYTFSTKYMDSLSTGPGTTDRQVYRQVHRETDGQTYKELKHSN